MESGQKNIDLTKVKLSEAEENAMKAATASTDNEAGGDLLLWLQGKSEQPENIRKLGEDATKKLNWYIVDVILKNYARLPKLFTYLETAETSLFENTETLIVDAGGRDKLLKSYLEVQKTTLDMLEFSRKFLVQNKDLLSDNVDPQDRMLLDKIKSLPLAAIQKVLSLIDDNSIENNKSSKTA